MLAKVIDFQDNFAFCQYTDWDNHNAYGYLHSLEVDDIDCNIHDKLSIGDKIEVELLYENSGDNILTSKGIIGNRFEDKIESISKNDNVICKIVKETCNGAIANVQGIPGYIAGNLSQGQTILATISKVIKDKKMILLNLDAVYY